MAITPTARQIERLDTLPRNEVAFNALLDIIDTQISNELANTRKHSHANLYRVNANDRSAEIAGILSDGRRMALEDIKKLLGTLVVGGTNER